MRAAKRNTTKLSPVAAEIHARLDRIESHVLLPNEADAVLEATREVCTISVKDQASLKSGLDKLRRIAGRKG